MRPSITGGANWSGAAVDPETGHLFVTSRNADSVMKYRETEPGEPATLRYVLLRDVAGPQMPRGLPLWKPPYSRVTAIDMNSGEHVWMTPLGNGDRFRNNPMLRDLDLPPLGGDGRGAPLLTKTLLIIPVSAGGSDGAASRGVRQGERSRSRVARPAGWRVGCADNLSDRRCPVHRADGWRRRLGARRVPGGAALDRKPTPSLNLPRSF